MMNTSFNIGLNLSNAQKLTPQMQQAIKLLQLSSLELEQEVQMKLDSNPLLERVEEDNIEADDFNSVEELTRLEHDSFAASEDYDPYNNETTQEEAYHGTEMGGGAVDIERSQVGLDEVTNNTDGNQSNVTPLEATHNSATNEQSASNSEPESSLDNSLELSIDTDWDTLYSHASTALASPDFEGMDDYQGATSVSLQEHLRWQLNFSELSELEQLIADYLLDAMDEYGFIQIDSKELKESFDEMASFYQWEKQIELSQIDRVIEVIQGCEPLGVGARNLAESLQIQLRHLHDSTPYREDAIRLLDEHQLLVTNNIKMLIQRTGIKHSDIRHCIELIKTLNASPGQAFSTAQPEYHTEPEVYDIPDVLVRPVSNNDSSEPVWKVELNPETLPKLRVNQEYANLVKRGDNSPDNVYLRDNLVDARLFIRSIEERNQNLLKVATCIVRLQQGFLVEGATAMKPMILRDVADEVGLHESTVSRLTTSKSILTPQGLFPLKHFFSSHVSSDKGDISSTAISAMIEALIKAEDPKKPLSDSAIKQHLETEGIDIARRTVAKYREAMNIGSSTQRKVKF